MADSISRRSLLSHSIPAVALAGTFASATLAQAAQDAPPTGLPNEGFKDGKYVLPQLPYAYDALEPYIDAKTMELHHSKHQQAYVDGLNKALVALKELRAEQKVDPAKLAGLSRDVTFNAGGHILHTAFFATLAKPTGDGTPPKEINDAIAAQYGSLDAFKAHFSAAAEGVKGSGWAIAWWEPLGDQIVISQSKDQDTAIVPGAVPLVLIDVWEHAYYLKYQNKRVDYVKAWWNVLNWQEVNTRYLASRKMFGKP